MTGLASLRASTRSVRVAVGVFAALTVVIAGSALRRHFRTTAPSRPLVCEDRSALGAAPRIDSYETTFDTAENSLSEGGRWRGGRTVGLDWADVRSARALAFGTQSGINRGKQRYDDSTALLSGQWAPDQSATAVVHSVDPTGSIYEEVELRLRSSLAPHCANGYEVLFRCSKGPKAYTQIVRWNGPLGEFTHLAIADGPEYGVADGDVVKATVVGDVITAFVNGRKVLEARDIAYTSGSPGIGFFLQGERRTPGNCGFTRFAASAN
jgi:hypothetical protein